VKTWNVTSSTPVVPPGNKLPLKNKVSFPMYKLPPLRILTLDKVPELKTKPNKASKP